MPDDERTGEVHATSPSEDTQTTPPAAPAKATRSRRAKPPAEPAPGAAAPAAGEAATKAPAKRSTRARAAAAAAEPPGTAPPEAPEAAAADEAGPRRRRATKKAAAPSASPEAPQPAAAEPAESAEVATAAATPAERPARRGRRTKAAEAAEGAETAETTETTGTQAAAEAAEAPAPTRSRRRRGEPAGASEAGAATEAAAPAHAGPPVVLFQAPQPVAEAAPRRKRARKETAAEPAAEPGAEVEAGEPEVAEAAPEAGPEETETEAARRRRRRGRRGRGRGRGSEDAEDYDETGETAAEAGETEAETEGGEPDEGEAATGEAGRRRRRRRRRRGEEGDDSGEPDVVVHVREPRRESEGEVRGVSGSTRLEAKRLRRREGREQGRRRPPILTEAEFLTRREAVERVMVVRQHADRTQVAVLEDGVLVEHYVTKASATSYVGNVYLGKVQNVLPSMEAAFVDIGKGRNAVLYAGEVNYDAAGIEGKATRIEQALKPGQMVLVQVTKDPIGHKGARLTSQVSLPGRYLVYVPGGNMTGISRKLPDKERTRLKSILKKVTPEGAGVIVRTAAEGASEDELTRDVGRLQAQWEEIQKKADKGGSNGSPTLLHAEPDLVIRVIRDIFNEDFKQLVVQGDSEWFTVEQYVDHLAPDLAPRLTHWVKNDDVFAAYRVDEQLAKALDRKVWLPSGGSLVIDRTEAMVVIDVNTGRFTGKGGNLEETVTKNNLEAAEEIVRQLRLRDLGGIIVIDFIDMVLESNRELVLRRLIECLGRDRTKHQVAEVTSLGLVQMTRKRVGQGLLESFSEPCPECNGRGVKVRLDGAPLPVERKAKDEERGTGRRERKKRGQPAAAAAGPAADEVVEEADRPDEESVAEAVAEAAEAAADAVVDVTGEEVEPEPTGDGGRLADVADDVPAAEPAPVRSGRRRGRRGASAEPDAGTTAGEPAASAEGHAEVLLEPAEPRVAGSRQPGRPARRRRSASRPAGPPAAAASGD